jgi:fucose 4-O-acetylase-like acetyltransferase
VRRALAHSREARIDALKGFAIICVVTYHALGQYYWFSPSTGVVYYTWVVYLRAFLYSFMLPLFAFLSGYVLGRPGGFRPGEYFRKRTLGLLVPYVAWEILYGPSKHPEMLASLQAFLAYCVHIFTDPHFEGRMWYLYVLWLSLMMLGLVRLRGDRTWAIVVSIPIVFQLGSYGEFNALQWIYACIAGGVIWRRYEPSIKPRLSALGIIGAVAFVPLWLASEPDWIAAARLERYVTTQPALLIGEKALTLLPVLASLCGVVAAVAASYRIPGLMETPLAFLGTLSLGIYITHFPFVEMWKGMPWWFLPINVILATAIAVGWTLALGGFRLTATVLLGEPWVRRPRELGDVQTETL